eukprot:Nk52_evm3s704 gene=Nk52_evmTU3s704
MPAHNSEDVTMNQYPSDVGIRAIEVYFPSTCVNQTDLEAFDGVSAGKYTIGLGQTNMGFCNDNEDINSICLTAVNNLMEKYNISPKDIGRLEVGTETIIDKSKSVKTVLMQLFAESGNTEIEGIDTTNACYGGTAAVFNAVNWVESRSWDGRYALVVCGDIAVYASGAARPTGGAGCVAMLIGPDAPLVFETGLKSTHMEHAWDFYKPRLESEYPEVDGALSIQSYLKALDICYQRFCSKCEKQGENFDLTHADYSVFHCPFNKLVQKSFGRLMYNDFIRDSSNPKFAEMQRFKDKKVEETYFDKELEKAFVGLSKDFYNEKVLPSCLLSKQLGNMYTASLYGGLASVFINKTPQELNGKRILMFSYGSGLASSMFSLRCKDTTSIHNVLKGVNERLAARKTVKAEEFDSTMALREQKHNLCNYKPSAKSELLFPGTFYIKNIDEKFRREYSRYF